MNRRVASVQAVKIRSVPFGKLDSQTVRLFELESRSGLVVRLSELGATLTQLHTPDRHGQYADVVLGFDTVEEYAQHDAFFGAIVGRVANRIANARCQVAGKQLDLAANDPPHHLHGGPLGWDKRLWSGRPLESAAGCGIEFSYTSADGEEGYPGKVEAVARYLLADDDSLVVEMEATSDRSTVVNMAHHTYWNLDGHNSGSACQHTLRLLASHYTPGSPVPNGTERSVQDTPFDFRQGKPIAQDLAAAGATPTGFDHNWQLDGETGTMRQVATLSAASSGRRMKMYSDAPSIQFYSGNFLDGSLRGKGGAKYEQHAGVCLETQAPPNAINIPKWQELVVLEPGKRYSHRMRHEFDAGTD